MIISLNRNGQFIFKMDTDYVICEVGTTFLYFFYVRWTSVLKWLRFGSQFVATKSWDKTSLSDSRLFFRESLNRAEAASL